jgi:hypothetical protein
VLFAETVVLDRPALGAMSMVVIAGGPVRISDIERLPRGERTIARLRARWPDAVVRATVVDVR